MAKWFSCVYVSMCSPSLSFSIFPYSFPLWFVTEHCCCSGPKLCPALCDSVNHSTPGFPVLHYLLELAQTHVHWLGAATQPSHPVTHFCSCPQSFPASGSFLMSQLFASGGFSFSISPSNEYSELISFRIDWFDLIAVQGTPKSLLQHHSSKASILQHF